jgi:hypothetical protein
MNAASTDICSKCGRTRPSYIADPSCSKDGYCDWVTHKLHVDITGKLESQFSTDTNYNSDWIISQLDGNVFTDLIELLRDVDGKVVRIRIDIVDQQSKKITTPECPGPFCLMCSGEACALCDAGCWNNDPNRPLCEHDSVERHETAVARP